MVEIKDTDFNTYECYECDSVFALMESDAERNATHCPYCGKPLESGSEDV